MKFTAAVLVTAAVFACSGRGEEKSGDGAAVRGSGRILDLAAVGEEEAIVVREGVRRGGEREWRDLVSRVASDGAVAWEVRAALYVSPGAAPSVLASRGPQGLLVAVVGNPPASPYQSVQVLDGRNGALLWSTAPRERPPVWTLSDDGLYELLPARLIAYDARRGTQRWSVDLPYGAEGSSRAWLTRQSVIVARTRGGDGETVIVKRADGAATSVPGVLGGLCVAGGASVGSVLTGDARLGWFPPEAGAEIAEFAGVVVNEPCGARGEDVITALDVHGDLGFGRPRTEVLAAIDLRAMAVRWKLPIEGAIVQPASPVWRRLPGQWGAYHPLLLAQPDSLAMIDVTDGRIAWRSPPLGDRARGEIIAADGAVLFAPAGLSQVLAFDARTGDLTAAVALPDGQGVRPWHVLGATVWMLDGGRSPRRFAVASLAPRDGGAPLRDVSAEARRWLGR